MKLNCVPTSILHSETHILYSVTSLCPSWKTAIIGILKHPNKREWIKMD